MRNIKEKLLDEIHKEFGICRHCGTSSCFGKKGMSNLPKTINTNKLLKILDKVLDDEN